MLILTLSRRESAILKFSRGNAELEINWVNHPFVGFKLNLPEFCTLTFQGVPVRSPQNVIKFQQKVKDDEKNFEEFREISDGENLIKVGAVEINGAGVVKSRWRMVRVGFDDPTRKIHVYRKSLELYGCPCCEKPLILIGQNVCPRVNLCFCENCKKVFVHDGVEKIESRAATFTEITNSLSLQGLERKVIRAKLAGMRGGRTRKFLSESLKAELIQIGESLGKGKSDPRPWRAIWMNIG